jgi:hypothetical protein
LHDGPQAFFGTQKAFHAGRCSTAMIVVVISTKFETSGGNMFPGDL